MSKPLRPSIGINRGEHYWCASCGDLPKGPCEHYPRLFLAAPELLEALTQLLPTLYNSFEPDNQSKAYLVAQAAIRKATEVQP